MIKETTENKVAVVKMVWGMYSYIIDDNVTCMYLIDSNKLMRVDVKGLVDIRYMIDDASVKDCFKLSIEAMEEYIRRSE